MIPTPIVPFSNGTEERAWMGTWCEYCINDHGMHNGNDDTDDACELLLDYVVNVGTPEWRWPEAWLPEPDDGQFFLPSRMTCAMFKPCHKSGCAGDPGASERAERVTEVTVYWRNRRTDAES